MIEAVSLTKRFEDIVALDDVTATIKEGQVFGLIGTNGAGKSTFLRCLCGVYKADGGKVMIDGAEVYERPHTKSRIFFISDEQYFFPGATPLDMAASYAIYNERFDRERFRKLLKEFGLDERRKISTFSKGMKKQLSVISALSAYTEYIFCDETFDGLDPVMRQAVKSLFAHDMDKRGLTPVIASHNLRELEDICDHVGLLHKGGILLSKDIVALKLGVHKIQCVFAEGKEPEEISSLEVIKVEKRGRLRTMTVRGDEASVRAAMDGEQTVFYELIPLSLEEIFITETEIAGYDIKKIILGE